MADLWTAIKIQVGACAAIADLDTIKNDVLWAQYRIGLATLGGSFLQGHSEVLGKLEAANAHLGDVTKGLEKVSTICKDLVALQKIHNAVTVLSEDQIMRKDPQKAADSFDILFQGFGVLCRHLPSPAKEWAEFFENFNLFGGVQRNMYEPAFRAARDARDLTGTYDRKTAP
jgi:hypothetical protein